MKKLLLSFAIAIHLFTVCTAIAAPHSVEILALTPAQKKALSDTFQKKNGSWSTLDFFTYGPYVSRGIKDVTPPVVFADAPEAIQAAKDFIKANADAFGVESNHFWQLSYTYLGTNKDPWSTVRVESHPMAYSGLRDMPSFYYKYEIYFGVQKGGAVTGILNKSGKLGLASAPEMKPAVSYFSKTILDAIGTLEMTATDFGGTVFTVGKPTEQDLSPAEHPSQMLMESGKDSLVLTPSWVYVVELKGYRWWVFVSQQTGKVLVVRPGFAS